MSKKAFGQVFTPQAVVTQMLDTIGYTESNDAILSGKIMEPSFGLGVFLHEITSRLISAARRNHCDPARIAELLAENIHGVELDETLYRRTLDNLNAYVAELGIPPVKWSLIQGDTVELREKYNEKFDFVAGNPPYVRIHNIPQYQREALKGLHFTTGTTDLYVAFFELGINFLSPQGRLAYITPNTFMKNTSQRGFRKHVIENRLLTHLTDYRSEKIFTDADTYATITYLDADSQVEEVGYDLVENNVTVSSVVPYTRLLEVPGSAWNFSDPDNILEKQRSLTTSVADLMTVQYGVSTLRDKLYIDNNPVIGDETTLINGSPIENGILRPAVKISTYKGGPVKGRAIFPYRLHGGKYIPMEESVLAETYPLAYAYLLGHREELLMRSMEKNSSAWYQYGRSQSLSVTDKPKLAFGQVIHPDRKVVTYLFPAGTIVYSGFFGVPLPGTDLAPIREALEHRDFIQYAKAVGKDMSGGFVAIAAKHLKAYRL